MLDDSGNDKINADETEEKLDELADLLFDMWVIKCNEGYNENNEKEAT